MKSEEKPIPERMTQLLTFDQPRNVIELSGAV
jgi:hypothetical protein